MQSGPAGGSPLGPTGRIIAISRSGSHPVFSVPWVHAAGMLRRIAGLHVAVQSRCRRRPRPSGDLTPRRSKNSLRSRVVMRRWPLPGRGSPARRRCRRAGDPPLREHLIVPQSNSIVSTSSGDEPLVADGDLVVMRLLCSGTTGRTASIARDTQRRARRFADRMMASTPREIREALMLSTRRTSRTRHRCCEGFGIGVARAAARTGRVRRAGGHRADRVREVAARLGERAHHRSSSTSATRSRSARRSKPRARPSAGSTRS